MTDALGLEPQQLQALLQVREHPDHQRGLEDGHFFVLERTEKRAAALVRLTGIVTGAMDAAAWQVPNAAVRLEFPETPAEFAEIDGAPATTSRVYTVAEVEIEPQRIHLDVVLHDAPSPAMRWVASATPGARVRLLGPRGHQVPGPGNPRVLLADSSALPAAVSILLRQPSDAATTVVAAVPTDEFALLEQEATGATLIHHDGALGEWITAAALPESASVWACGERDDMRVVRDHCRTTLGLPRERMQVFGYWKRGTSNTRLDVARLQAAHTALSQGRAFDDTDDFEIGI